MSRPDAYGWASGMTPAPPKKKPWTSGFVVALAGACLLLGAVGGALAENQANEPVAPQTVSASPLVKTEKVTVVPPSCMAAIRQFGHTTVLSQRETMHLLRALNDPADRDVQVALAEDQFHTVQGTVATAVPLAKTCLKAAS